MPVPEKVHPSHWELCWPIFRAYCNAPSGLGAQLETNILRCHQSCHHQSLKLLRTNACRFAERGPKLVKPKQLGLQLADTNQLQFIIQLHMIADTVGPSLPPEVEVLRLMIRTWKIRPGDLVMVISGGDKGSSGEVLMIDPRRNMLKVKDMNKRKARKRMIRKWKEEQAPQSHKTFASCAVLSMPGGGRRGWKRQVHREKDACL